MTEFSVRAHRRQNDRRGRRQRLIGDHFRAGDQQLLIQRNGGRVFNVVPCGDVFDFNAVRRRDTPEALAVLNDMVRFSVGVRLRDFDTGDDLRHVEYRERSRDRPDAPC